MSTLAEGDVEGAALAWPASLGCQVARGHDITPDVPGMERADFVKVVVER